MLCDNMCIGALDKCCNDANEKYGCSMVETCCNGVCCGLNHECCDGKCVSSMGPHSCSAESDDDDSGGSTAFRLSNRDKTILAALFLAVFFGFLGFKLFKNNNKQASTKKKKRKSASM